MVSFRAFHFQPNHLTVIVSIALIAVIELGNLFNKYSKDIRITATLAATAHTMAVEEFNDTVHSWPFKNTLRRCSTKMQFHVHEFNHLTLDDCSSPFFDLSSEEFQIYFQRHYELNDKEGTDVSYYGPVQWRFDLKWNTSDYSMTCEQSRSNFLLIKHLFAFWSHHQNQSVIFQLRIFVRIR